MTHFNSFRRLGVLVSLLGLSSFALLGAACSGNGTPDEAAGEHVDSADSALTAAQCSFFDVNGKDTICHHTGSAKHPYTIIKTSEQGCINGHAGHAGDYIAVGDPTCQGGGCLPEHAPCDATLPCCDGSTCQSGTCVANAPVVCPCAADPSWGIPPGNTEDACFTNAAPANIVRLIYGAGASESGVYGDNCGDSDQFIAITPAQRTACIASLKAIDAVNGGNCTACAACTDGCVSYPGSLECF